MAIPRSAPATRLGSRRRARGGFLLGMFTGLAIGLAVSLMIAFYLNRTQIPFLAGKPKASEKEGVAPAKPPAIAGLPQGSSVPPAASAHVFSVPAVAAKSCNVGLPVVFGTAAKATGGWPLKLKPVGPRGTGAKPVSTLPASACRNRWVMSSAGGALPNHLVTMYCGVPVCRRRKLLNRRTAS